MSTVDSDNSVWEDGESQSEETSSEVETPEAEATAPITSGRGPPSTSSVACRKCGVPLGRVGILPSGEGLANASAAANTSHGPDNRYVTLDAGEAKPLAEYIFGPLRFSLRDRTRG